MKRRYWHFVHQMLARMPTDDFDRALIDAANDSGIGGMMPLRDDVMLRRAKKLLKHPDVRAAILGAYEQVGFTVIDAMEKHVDHIMGVEVLARHKDGELVLDAHGQPIKVRVNPNYAALRDYLMMAMPKHERVNKNVNVNVSGKEAATLIRERNGPPQMAARIIDALPGEHD